MPKSTPSATASDERNPVPRPGGRSARVKASVLESTLQELQDAGYLGFNLLNVARRAGVHETTIYRRWRTKEQLIHDACMAFVERQMPLPDTGSLFTDLKITLGNLVELIKTPIGHALVLLAFSARDITDFTESALSFWKLRIALGQRVFENAAARGEWPETHDAEWVFAQLVGPVLARYFLLQQEITPRLLESGIRQVLSSVPGGPAGQGRAPSAGAPIMRRRPGKNATGSR